MLLQIAFVSLCLAQVLRFSTHWLVLTRNMQNVRDHEALTTHLDWKRPATSRRAPKKKGALGSFWRG